MHIERDIYPSFLLEEVQKNYKIDHYFGIDYEYDRKYH